MKSNLAKTGHAALLAILLAVQAVFSQTTHWNVVEAGAKGDGQADDTPLFQRLLDEAGKAGGGVVDVPAGRFRINGHLTVPANVTLQGIFRVPPTSGPRAITNLTGSVLLAYEGRGKADGPPFIRLVGRNAAIAGLIIAYPELCQAGARFPGPAHAGRAGVHGHDAGGRRERPSLQRQHGSMADRIYDEAVSPVSLVLHLGSAILCGLRLPWRVGLV